MLVAAPPPPTADRAPVRRADSSRRGCPRRARTRAAALALTVPWVLAAPWALATSWAPPEPRALAGDDSFPTFVDVARSLGVEQLNLAGGVPKDYIVEVNGNGAGFFDYDGDGDSDLLIANGSTLESYAAGGDPMMGLYRNDGPRFAEVTHGSRLLKRGWGMGVCVADYDDDGHPDFYLTAYGANALYRNNGDGTFAETTETAGADDPRWSTNCTFGDYDRDGDVDLYVANYVHFDVATVPRRGQSDDCRYLGAQVFCGPLGLAGQRDSLFRNEADGTFSDVTAASGVQGAGQPGFGAVFTDLDDDGWPELYVANDATPNQLFHNNRDGTFTEDGLVSGTAFSAEGRAQSGMGVGVGDFDGDRRLDLFVTNYSRDTNTLYRNHGELVFVPAETSAGLGKVSHRHLGWGTGFADLDNDGWPEIFVANGHVYPEIDVLDPRSDYLQPKEVYRNAGSGRFEVVPLERSGDLAIPKAARGSAFSDFDDDGDVDIVVVNLDDRPSLYRNDGGNRRNWIGFRLAGADRNRSAIGARIEVDADGRTQIAEIRSGGSYLSHDDLRAHFGLGEASRVERARIRWPDGTVSELQDLAVNRLVTVRQGLGVIERSPSPR